MNMVLMFIGLLYSCTYQNWHELSGVYDYKTNYIIKTNDEAVIVDGNMIGRIKSIQAYPSQFTSKPGQKEIRVDSVLIQGKVVSLTLGATTISNEELKIFFIQVEYGKSEFSYAKTKKKIRRTLDKKFK